MPQLIDFDSVEQLKTAKTLFDEMGGDPQVAIAVVKIAKSFRGDPQNAIAILRIADFIRGLSHPGPS